MTRGTKRRSEDTVLTDEAPSVDALTAYDEAHMAVYLQLLYGTAEGYSISRLAREAFDIDVGAEPERAEKIVNSHLRRAKWLTEGGRHYFLTAD
ncbi:MAG TPA: DUF2285 domain-containing protein [Terriglobia bacterium]|nr:DUF2285 domain-containing protein [Terriglobia bacterium]